jgi:hypothetical protein
MPRVKDGLRGGMRAAAGAAGARIWLSEEFLYLYGEFFTCRKKFSE